MDVCCAPEFKEQVEKRRKQKAYAAPEAEVAVAYGGAPVEQAATGDWLFPPPGLRFVKKRLAGRGG